MLVAVNYVIGKNTLPSDITRACGLYDTDPTSCSDVKPNPCCNFHNVITAWQAYPSATVTALAGRAIGDLGTIGAGWVGDPVPHVVIEYRCANSLDSAGSLSFAATASQSNCKYYFTIAAVGFDPNTNSRAILQTTVRAVQ